MSISIITSSLPRENCSTRTTWNFALAASWSTDLAYRYGAIAAGEARGKGVDIVLGPKAPRGMETNWIPTDPKRDFELMFRLYAPTKALFDKTWVLPDVERAAK